MASIILSAAGTALGGAVGGPLGSFVGGKIGQLAGGFVERTLLAPKLRISGSGGRLSELGVQASTYGRMIPVVYGSVRTAGNVIWARPIKEVATTTTTTSGGGGKGGGAVTQSSTSYSYYVSLAIAICEGEVDEVLRIWADAKQVDLSTAGLTIYRGSETQTANSFIQSFQGAGNTPAYRGMAYVVFEDFPLADFGNRIPNFTFEVRKRVQVADFNEQVVEDAIESVVLIPGAGEFVYDTVAEQKIPGQQTAGGWAQNGAQVPVNMHNAYGKANSLLALDQLESACPNVEWVAVVVAWFADSLDIGAATLKPGVEYQVGAITSPNLWSVAGYNRSTARLITQVSGSPQYGGTPDDGSVVRLCTELQARGYKVLLYPMLFVDTSGKPWRGTMTGDAADVHDFFTASGLSAGWNGCVVSRSDDGGGNYTAIAGLAVPSTMGSAVDALPPGALGAFDEANEVTVSLLGDATLESVTDEAVLNGANLALLGGELIQFGVATLQSPGIYTLSRFLRGRFCTESAIGTHEAAEHFVLLNSNTQAIAMAAGLLHLPRSYKAVTIGGAIGDVVAQNFTFHANNLKPFNPVHLSGSRDASGNLTLSWIRRTRIGGEWADYADAPIGEETERYEVEIVDGSDVVRTFTGLTSATASYTAAQQTTDFGSPQASVSVRVYQISAQIGRGYPANAAI